MHDDQGTHIDPIVEVDDVVVDEAYATGGHGLPDCPGLRRAVEAIEGTAHIERARAQRVSRAARHIGWEIRHALAHLCWRCPAWPLGLAGYDGLARPGDTV